MSKEISVVMLGIFVAVLPFLGFPQSWRVIFFVIAGLGIMLLGFFLRADHLHREASPLPTAVGDGQNGARTMAARSPGRVRSSSESASKKISDIAAPPAVSKEVKPD